MTLFYEAPQNPFSAEFWESIENGSFSTFLTASPFCASGNYGTLLTRDFFFQEMFADTEVAYKKAVEVRDAHSSNHLEHKNLLIVGNRGSGKTTLLHHAFRMKQEELQKTGQRWSELENCFIIDFEDNAAVEPTRMEDIDRESNRELVHETFWVFIANTLLSTDHGDTPAIWMLFTSLFPNTEHQRATLTKMTPGGELERFFDEFQHRVVHPGEGEQYPTRSDIIDTLREMHLQPLIYLAAFSVLAAMVSRKITGDTYLVFDNIDCIGSERLSETVFSRIGGLNDHFTSFMTEYVSDMDQAAEIRHLLFRQVQIIVARETTMDVVVASSNQEARRWLQSSISTSNVYDINTVLDRRLELYHSACLAKGSSFADRIGDLKEFIGERLVSESLPALFNGNERVLSYVLARFVDNHSDALHLGAEELRRYSHEFVTPEKGESHASRVIRENRARISLARGVVLRSVIRTLQDEGYLNEQCVLLQKMKVQLRSRGESRGSSEATPSQDIEMPIALCILILLDNVQKRDCDLPFINPEKGIRLDHFLSYFQQFFPNSPKDLETLVNVLWRLYRREKDGTWCRLISIKELGADGHDKLRAAARTFPRITQPPYARNNPWIRINEAGAALVNLLFDHFEFSLWSSSTCDELSPLLSMIRCISSEALREELAGGVNKLKELSKPLEQVIATYFMDRSLFGAGGRPIYGAYPFVIPTQYGNSWQYYIERRMYTALQYIDDARLLLSCDEIPDEERDEVNRVFADIELSVLKCFDSPDEFRIRESRLKRLAEQRLRLQAIKDDPAGNWRRSIFSVDRGL